MPSIDVLIRTYNRPAALAATLLCLRFQRCSDFRIIVADQSRRPAASNGAVQAAVRWLRYHGREVNLLRNLPRRGAAQQSQFLLERSAAPMVMYLDDDVLLEPFVLELMQQALRRQACGFVGMGLVGLSYRDDVRPDEQAVEFWDQPDAPDMSDAAEPTPLPVVRPETVTPDAPQWQRYKLHNAANLLHVQERYQATPDKPRLYKLAWSGGCVLYDRPKLIDCGGFSFWRDLPPRHAGEDALAQLRVMKKYGAAGILPSGAFHQELPTTIPPAERKVDAPTWLDI